MKRARVILTAALGLMLAACNVESDFLSQKKDLYTETITVSANRDGIDVNGPDGTRATLTEDNTLKSVWEAGDQLTVWTGNEFNEDNMSEGGFTLDSGAGTNSCTFTGKVKSTSKPNRSTRLTAVVDNDDDAVDCSSGTTAALDFSEQQGCTTADVLRYDALWAQATYGDRDFHFAHTMSFVEWTININGITAATTCDITLSATGLQNKASLDLAEGTLSGTNAGDIKLTGVSLDAQGKAVVYVALFPGQVTSKMTAAVTMADGSVTEGQLGTFDSFTFVANTLYTASWTFDAPESNYTFEVTSPAAIAYNATTTSNYTVKSYTTVGGTQQPVAWEVTKYEYSDDGGITWEDGKPSWFSSLSLTSGEGSADGEKGRATVTAATLVNGNLVNSILENAEYKSNYDLSQGGETANCYVISAPGTYKIPLIIGNARNADGLENTACFNNNSPFVTYKGDAITSMWLMNHGGTPTSGSVVWKDVTTDIVKDLAVSSDKKFLTFTVPADAIKQGNAVVAVKDASGVIMWSWHLWFTESEALSTIAFDNADSETLYFMRDNLGFVYDTYRGTSYTTPRRVRVTVTQTGSNKAAQFEIIQKPSTSSATFHDTKYQFGRKDAFSGVTTGEPTFIDVRTTYQVAIQNPGEFYTVSSAPYVWCSTTYTNAWAVGNTSTSDNVSASAITKSVYDPCPAGFKMPGSNTFTFFSSSNSSGQGLTYVCDSNGSSLFIPFTGCRDRSSGALKYMNYGLYWTAVPHSTGTYVWSLFFLSSSSDPKYFNFDWPFGFSVRPVKNN